MTGFLREWFKYHFSNPDFVENKELRGKLWKEVDSSNILIESITKYKPTLVEKRPAVIIKRNEWQVQRAGIDDRLQGGVSLTGERYYSTFLTGSHTLFCIAGHGTEAEILGGEVYRELLQFGPIIRQELDMMRFVLVGVGALFELEEASENYAVPVTVSYAAEEKWLLQPYAPTLKRVVLSSFLP